MSESRAIAAPIAPPDALTMKKYLFSLLFFGAFSALCIRGFFEATIGKALAYLMQLGLWTAVQFCAVVFFRFRPTGFLAFGILLTLLFGVTGVISSLVTLDVAGFQLGIITTVVNVYLLFLFVAGYGFRTEVFSAKVIAMSMAVSGTLLPLFGTLQLFGIAELPGRSLTRPPSLTGSYLHFPLLCGVLGICLLEIARSLRWRSLYLVSLFCFFGVAISGGRSGTLVLVGTGALYVLFEFSRQPAATKMRFALFAGMLIVASAVLLSAVYQYSPALQRIARVWDLQEEGNNLRVAIWTEIYVYWTNTNLWFGEYTGMVGNTTNFLAGGIGLVAESGALQQLINFGLLGFLFFYAVMLLSYFAIEKECTFLRALFISAMIQTAFYQSTEVLPYMAMLAFLPTLSQCLRAGAVTAKPGEPLGTIWKRRWMRLRRYSNQGR